MKKALAVWSKETFGDVFRKVVDLEDQVRIKETQLEIFPTQENREELNKGNAELRRFYLYEEEF